MNYINVAKIQFNSRVLGPGKRNIVWVQGCNLNCKDCINKHFQAFEERYLYSTDELTNKILENKDEIEGITITGGEPFLQAKGLSIFIKNIKKKGLTIQIYSGYSLEELIKSKDKYVYAVLDSVDVLIDGRYKKEDKIEYGFKGSNNQNIYFFTNKYTEKNYQNNGNNFEISYEEKLIRVVGFYDTEKFDL